MELLDGEVWQVSKRNSQYFRSYLRKTTGRWGPFAPPPSGARVNSKYVLQVQTYLNWSHYAFVTYPEHFIV